METFPTDPWFQELVSEINESEAYFAAADTWEGDVAFVVEAEPDRGVPEDVWARLDLWHGKCRQGGLVDAESGAKSEYIIRAPYTRWKDVIRGELDPVRGMMQGKLRVQGDLPTILRYIGAVVELASLAESIDTRFPDGG